MPAATPLSLRQRVFELHQAGLAAPAIAGRLSLPPRTARHLLARWRRAPEAGLAPGPGRGGRPAAPGLAPAREDCLRLRRERPGWGAGRLRQELLKSYPPPAPSPPAAPCSAGCWGPAWPRRPPCGSSPATTAGPVSRTRSGRWTRWRA